MKYRYQRWLIKAALFHILLGISLGVYMYIEPITGNPLQIHNIRSVHLHLILLGGVMQMIMGVALWMFPRKKKPPHYTPAWQGMLLFGLFNSGIITRAVFELLGRTPILYYYVALGGVTLQVISLLFFGWIVFGRIRKP